MNPAARFLSLLCLVAALSPLGRGARPDIVVLLSDDHSPRDSSVYGSTDVPTPHMQRLADAGLTFDRAYVASPACAPSRASLLTGLMPARHGAEANHAKPKPDIKKAPAYLRELGYEVVAFGKVGHYDDTRLYGFDQVRYPGFHQDEAVPEAAKWLRARGKTDKPLALFVGTNWPHTPWPEKASARFKRDALRLPPFHVDTPRTREFRARYYTAVERMDRDIGLFYDAFLEVFGDTAFLIHTSDHGAQWPFGKWTCYEEGLRTPLIAVWPGKIAAGTRTSAMVGWIDILPTLLDLAGGDVPRGIDGRSFLPVLRGERAEHRESIFATHSGDIHKGTSYNAYPIRSVRRGNWKYIRNLRPEFTNTTHTDQMQSSNYFESWLERAESDPTAKALVERYYVRPSEELYDLSADPNEMRNLAGEPAQAERLAALRGELDAWMKEQGDRGTVFGEPHFDRTPMKAR